MISSLEGVHRGPGSPVAIIYLSPTACKRSSILYGQDTVRLRISVWYLQWFVTVEKVRFEWMHTKCK